MGLIYMRISPSGGKYIGQTVLSEEERWKDHCNGANNPNSSDYNCLLSKAIREFGKDNFSMEILEEGLLEEELNDREKYWISYYKTYYKDNPQHYNMTRGGGGRNKFSDEELLKLWNEGLTLKEIGQIIHGTPTYIGKRLSNLGINSNLFMERASKKRGLEAMKENKKYPFAYELWNEGHALTEIEQQTGVDIHHLSNMLQSLYNVSKDEIKERKNVAISNSKKKPILQYDLENNFIKEWPSAADAARALKIDHSSIRACVKKRRQSCGGYKWKEKN